jgi:peptidoglycan/LPS O-acetylase OafA/YrhL
VIIAHCHWYFPAAIGDNLAFRLVIGNGRHGVAVFFVISGYLITGLLLREFDKTGTVSLKRFYFRRTLRIFPPFYAFLAVVGLLWVMGIAIGEDLPSFLAAATYTVAYYPGMKMGVIFHSWSLSIEEQFYLLWPLTFLIWHRRQKVVNLAFILILLMPVVRLALYFIAPGQRGHEDYMVQGWVDTMMVGCLLALLKREPKWERRRRRYLNAWTASAMAITGFFVVPWVALVLPRNLSAPFGLVENTLTALCIGGVLVYVVENTDSLAAKILNNRVIRHVGVLSYSIYLWQALFTWESLPMLPYGLVYTLAAAEISYWLVERPALSLRTRLESRL